MEKMNLNDCLNGELISLRSLNVNLAEIMYEYVREDRNRLSKFLPWVSNINSVKDEIAFIDKSIENWNNLEGFTFGIFDLINGCYMGNISVFRLDWKNESCEIGYWILGKFEGKGYIRDSIKTLEKELFSVGFNRIIIECEPGNARSRKIPVSLSYRYEGTLRACKKFHEKFVDIEVHSKLKSDYIFNTNN